MVTIEFERQDLRRLWLTLGAIESLKNPTLANIARTLGMQMSTLQKTIERINSPQLPNTEVSVEEGVYSVASWGVINKKEVIEFFKQSACATLGRSIVKGITNTNCCHTFFWKGCRRYA